jgi:predicted nucleic acid-binding Zn ribbon protein
VSRTAPRQLAEAVLGFTAAIAPVTPLARVQEAWERAVGPVLSHAAQPISEHDGVLSIACSSAVWAQELSLMEVELLHRLNTALGEPLVRALRCRTG